MGWRLGCLPAHDVCGHVSLLEIAIPGIDQDGAAEKEEDMNLEFSGKGGRKPDAVRLGSVDDGKSQSGNVGPEQNANRGRNSAGEGGAYDDRLAAGGVDVCVAFPAKIGLVFGAKGNVIDIAAIEAFAAYVLELLLCLLFRGEGEQIGIDAVF